MPSDQVKMPDAFYESRLLSCLQVQEMMGISKRNLFHLLKDKKDPIPSLKIGRSRKFKLDKLIWWIDKHEE